VSKNGLLLEPEAPRTQGEQDGPFCTMTALGAKGQRTLIRDLARWWYVAHYYRKRQLAARLFRIGRRAVCRWARATGQPIAPGKTLALRENPGLRLVAEARLRGRSTGASRDRASEVLEGRFRFLNEERVLGERVDWQLAHSPDVARLWRFHLHYHEFLWDLVASPGLGDELRKAARAWDLVLRWIDACRPDESWALEDAWHPYCVSRRLPVWIGLWSIAPPAEAFGHRVLQSLFAQADHLARNLESDLGGNHLLENLRALILAGTFLACPEAERWRRKAERILLRELPEQILAHGEHFERSPMYHAAMLEALLDIRDAAARQMPQLSKTCCEAARRMAVFLRAILHPDGDIPLLGDSVFGESPCAEILLKRALGNSAGSFAAFPSQRLAGTRERKAETSDIDLATQTPSRTPVPESESPTGEGGTGQRVGDYWIYRDGGDFLLFDAGPVGPDHLPAHAHADLLTIEASLGGQRLLVDSGVFDYEDGPSRRYCRSTAAHNVLEIDGEDQCDLWSRFRMGYRGWPTGLACGETEGFSWAWAEHNAYRRLGVPRVGRWLACRPGGPWFCLDWAKGTGIHQLTSWLHLHPETQVQKTNDRDVVIDHHGRRMLLRFLAVGEISVESGWYCPEFGLRLLAPVVRWTAKTRLPKTCGWWLHWGQGRGEARLEESDGTPPALVWSEDGQVRRFFPSRA
jgi:uncharacterized heparinase superfamily protein